MALSLIALILVDLILRLKVKKERHGEAQSAGNPPGYYFQSFTFRLVGERGEAGFSCQLLDRVRLDTTVVVRLATSKANQPLPAGYAGVDEVHHALSPSIGMLTLLAMRAIGKIETFMPMTHHFSPFGTGFWFRRFGNGKPDDSLPRLLVKIRSIETLQFADRGELLGTVFPFPHFLFSQCVDDTPDL